MGKGKVEFAFTEIHPFKNPHARGGQTHRLSQSVVQAVRP
jgi:hypothetical protein